MYYKVMKDNKVIDVLDSLTYLRWQPKHKIMVLCGIDEAQAVLSSDKNTIWHEKTLYNVPVNEPKFETVELVEISEFEYKQLRVLNMKTPESIIDEYNLLLLEMGVI